MSAQPRRTRRNLPALVLIFGVGAALTALCGPFASDSRLPKENDLQVISGLVQSTPSTTGPGKGGNKLHILVRGDDGLHILTQEDLMCQVAPGIMDLRVGDKVTARAEHDLLYRNVDWLWELQRGGVTILSYQDTRRYYEWRNRRMRKFCHWSGILTPVLFLVAILLRRRFGAWQDTDQPAGADVPDPPRCL